MWLSTAAYAASRLAASMGSSVVVDGGRVGLLEMDDPLWFKREIQ